MANTTGKKFGGRTKGTPNKRTVDVAERLEALGCDPILGMVDIANDTEAPIELRARMFSELSQYVAPKRKAIDMSSSDGSVNTGPHEIIVRVVKPGTEDM